jgi:teichuronic acid biosynthesis glycosyltransferase TuaH
MRRDCDIICIALSRWDSEIASPSLWLVKEFAKTNRVFYVEHPFSWKDFFTYRDTSFVQTRKTALLHSKNIYSNPPSLPPNITIVTTGVTIPINFLPSGFIYDQFRSINKNIVLKVIRKLIKDYEVKDFIYINFFDPYFVQELPPDIKPLRTIYQSMDDISQVKYSKRHGERLEEEVIRHSDYTLCTSRELTRLKKSFSPNVYFHPNGADIDIFEKAATQKLEKPEELKKITKKTIGYIGSVEYRSDFELIKKIATYHKDKMLFFVGPVYGKEHTEAGLDKMDNVVFIGPKKVEELPAFLQYFDCVIVPFKKNTLTKSIYPLKVNEYLAAGKPIIATHFSEDIYSFKDVVYVAEDDDEFLTLIDKAIAENNQERIDKRMEVAQQNTWVSRVKEFWEIIDKEPKPKF